MRIFQGLVLVALAAIVYLLARLAGVASLGYDDPILQGIALGAVLFGVLGAAFIVGGLAAGEWAEIDPWSRKRATRAGVDEHRRRREDGQVERGPE